MRPRTPTFDVDLDRLERLLWLLAAIGLGLALLGVVGEYAGWWNDVGELLISFGTVASVATGVLALLINATKDQVRAVADGVASNGTKLDRIRESHGEKLDRIQESHGEKLDRIHDDLGSVSDDLDEVNRHLENQHEVLVQIRDRL
jgi:hypothetical protein